jgi:hypothetical protein
MHGLHANARPASDSDFLIMSRFTLVFAVCGLSLALLSGCSTSQTMSPAQREGVELRRHCERNPQDTVKCLGFLGFL